MPPHAPRIPHAIWERHREEIIATYTSGDLPQTMAYMSEKYGFQATKNQYTGKLESWGIKKYNSGADWKLVARVTRKRKAEGKESDVTMRGRKFTKQEKEKAMARHVPLREQWYTSGDPVLPGYITVSTPPRDPTGISREDLLRNLPCYLYVQEIEALFSDRQEIIDTGHFSFESENDLPQLRESPEFLWAAENDIDEFIPPQWSKGSRCRSRTRSRTKTTALILKDFLQRFIFLATNNLLSEGKFDRVCKWIEKTLGPDALFLLCQLKSPPMRVFERMVLRRAVESGDLCLAARLIRREPRRQDDEIYRRQRWSQYLNSAISSGHASMVELLCQAGVPPKVNNGWAWTLKPWESRLPMLHNLLAARAHPVSFIADKEPGFPLVNAAQEGSLLAVQLLLNAGAPINITMPQYYGTALQAACWGDNLELARYLIEYGADTNIPHALPSSVCHRKSLTPLEYMALQTPIQIAAKRNNVRLVELLLQRGANANACPLFAHPDVELLSSYKPRRGAVYENSYRPRYKSQDYIQTSIQYAAINKNVEMVGLLLAQGVDPDSRVVPCLGDTALQISARLGNPEIFQLLISSGADVNATPGAHNGRTALQGAAESGNFEILSILGSLGVVGASINAPAGEELGMTALQAACLNGHSLFMGILLAHGADVNAAPSSVAGCTTVQAASWSGKIDIIRDLIELGASVGTRDNVLGTTALLASMEHQSLPILELLVTHGADVNELADGDLYTPIQKAAEYSWLKGVEFLLESGSNVNEVTIPAGKKVFGDESALGLAITNDADQVIDAQKMVTLLLEHGADVWGPAKVVGSHSIKTESSLIHALEQNPTLEVIHLLLAKVPELERHPGWAKALELAFRYCREDVTELILERTLSMPPSARLEVMKKAWDSLPDFSHMDSEQMLERITDLVIYERPLDGSAGLFINGRAPDGSTLLQRSCWAGFHEALPTLIRYGADVHTDATECHGTPLQEALKSKDVKSAYILLQHNVDINASSAKKDGVTALQAAAMNGLFTMAIRLLESGADVAATATPIGGRTAIDGAAERGRWDMVQMLSNAYEAQGLDVGQVSRQAAEHAEREEHTELAEWLRGYPPS